MAPNPNFQIRATLAEADDIRDCLRRRLQDLSEMPIAQMSEAEKLEAGRIETLLRRDFS